MKKYLQHLNYFIFLILIILDIITKTLVSNMEQSIVIFKGLSIKYITNKGALFSLFQGSLSNSIFILLSILAIVFLIILYKKESQLFVLLMLAGVIGNLIDRIIRGAVVDFISIGNFPIFNLADSYIVIGVSIYFIMEWIGINKKNEIR